MFNSEEFFMTRQAYDLLRRREKLLRQLLQEKKKNTKGKAEGKLHITKSKTGRVQYYLRKDASEKSGKYIRKSNTDFASRLAQREYDEAVIEAVERELSLISRLLRKESGTEILDIFKNTCDEKRKLVTPVEIENQLFAEKWMAEEYEKSIYHEDNLLYETKRHERVRSKSEMIIANLLNDFEVPYKYECPLYVDGTLLSYPDFTTLNVRNRKVFYWEHLGMMEDFNYQKNAFIKIDNYQRNGIIIGKNLLCTFESQSTVLNVEYVNRLIKEFLK